MIIFFSLSIINTSGFFIPTCLLTEYSFIIDDFIKLLIVVAPKLIHSYLSKIVVLLLYISFCIICSDLLILFILLKYFNCIFDIAILDQVNFYKIYHYFSFSQYLIRPYKQDSLLQNFLIICWVDQFELLLIYIYFFLSH